MAQVFPDTVKLYYEESRAARAQIEGLLEKYRGNTSTLLALSTAAVAFFGFSTGPRQPVFYWIAIGSYLLAVTMAMLIFKPIPMKINVARDTAQELFVPPPISPTKIYYDYARGHQDAISHAQAIVDGKFGVATRFRTLIAAIAVLIVAASFSVILGSEQPASPTHVIIDRSMS
jgi:hypothetical protein